MVEDLRDYYDEEDGECDNNNHPRRRRRMCIIGGGGYFGQCIARCLQQQGHDVIIVDIHFGQFDDVIKLDKKHLKTIEGSCLDSAVLDRALVGCCACFHLAAYGMSGGASLNKHMTYRVNVTGTELAIDACIRHNVKRFIYASTVSVVFHGQPIIDGDETLPYAPFDAQIDYYSITKTIAERYVLSMNGIQLGNGAGVLRTCALRFRGIYGPAEPRTTKRTAEMCIRGYLRFRFTQSANHICSTQYSGANNSADAMRLAEEALRRRGMGGEAYFIVDGGEPVESFEFWRPLMLAMGCTYRIYSLPFRFVYYIAFMLELLYRLTGIEPIMTRLEVNMVGVTNTYSIAKAQRELNYNPIVNHNLQASIDYFQHYFDEYPIDNHNGIINRRLLLMIGIFIFAAFLTRVATF